MTIKRPLEYLFRYCVIAVKKLGLIHFGEKARKQMNQKIPCARIWFPMRKNMIWRIIKSPNPSTLYLMFRKFFGSYIELSWINFNSFSTNVTLLYLLKTSEKRRFYVFRGYRSGNLFKNGLTQYPRLSRWARN